MVFIGYKFSTQKYDEIFEILFDSTEITQINEGEKHQNSAEWTQDVVEPIVYLYARQMWTSPIFFVLLHRITI